MAKSDNQNEKQKDDEDKKIEDLNVKNDLDNNQDVFDQLLSKLDSDNYLPWESVVLPSKGIFYDGALPGGKVDVRPMSVDVDKMMVNQRIVQNGELFNKIVEACVRLPDGFSVYDLLANDQYFLLYYLRGITHGSDYEFVSDCPFCGTKSTYEYDLSELSKTMKHPNPEFSHEPLEVRLPKLSIMSNKEVFALVRLMRVRDVMAASTDKEKIIDPIKKGRARNKKASKSNSGHKMSDTSKVYLDSMKSQIVGFKVGDDVCKDQRRFTLLDQLHQADSAIIRDFIDDVSPGIDTAIEVTCQDDDCGKDYTIQLPFGENFFRPHAR